MRKLVVACLALTGCVGAPSVPEQFASASRATVELQTRRYEGARPEDVLPVAVAALQDFGFQVMKSDVAVGLIVAERGLKKSFGEYHSEFWRGYWQSMRNTFTFQWHSRGPNPEKMVGPAGLRAAVSITPAGAGAEVRVTLHRFVSRPTGEPILVWAEEIAEPEVYARFFDLLSQALAREAPKIGVTP
ncbi:MAG TPA: hypothetical protein VFC18_05840 [Burkholderiales bacterium]|nr:hypothetical protein [Burkholderiales bacterium]